jgi:hypothetical protein
MNVVANWMEGLMANIKSHVATAPGTPPDADPTQTGVTPMGEQAQKPQVVPDTPVPESTANAAPKTTTPSDASDFDSLWQDPKLGDGIANMSYHSVPVGRPKDFFRTHPDPLWRRRTEIYTHKPEGAIDEQYFIIGPSMRGRIPEARPCTLTTVIYRDGSLRLWPIKFPKDGERDNDAWVTARNVAKDGLTRWVKLVWAGRAFVTRDAQSGYAPDPDVSKIPPFNELVWLALGENRVIRDESHYIYRELFGIAPRARDSESDDDDGTL